MGREKIPQQNTPIDKEDEPQLVPSEPGLNYIYKTLGLLEGYTEWKKSLPEKIGPWENSQDLFNNVQRAVMEQVEDKVPGFKNEVPSLDKIPVQQVLDTIINNWPEDIEDDLPKFKGQRRKILLSVAAHAVKHMETVAYQEIISNADEKDLEKLGLNTELREVTTKLLDASMRADNLFIRFLAFSGLSPKPPEGSSSTRFYLPEDKTTHTINELFPRDTQYLSRKFKEIADMPIDWENISGGETFKEYLIALSESYQEKDIEKIDEYYKKVSELYKQSTLSDFPILIIPPEYSGGYHKPPYFDPELKVTLKSPECLKEEKDLGASQRIISQQLEKMGYPGLAKNVMGKEFKVVNSIGDYGVNLVMKTTGQMGESVGMVFLGEQRKVQDMLAKEKNFKIGNTKEQYSSKMSLFVTSFHEFCHFRNSNDPALERLGDDSCVIIGEVVAEQFYRQFLPELIKQGAIEGTEEEWASAALENSLEELMDKPKTDPYYYMAVYTLNKLFEQRVVEFDFKTGVATIKDVDAFYRINKELSKEAMNLYENETMDKRKAKKWIKDNCMPNEIVEKISKFVKKELVGIDELPENPETGPVKIFPWESAWIKKPNPNNSDDIDGYKRIEAQPSVKKWMDDAEEPSSTEEVQAMFQEIFYGIYGGKDQGAMEGFVWFYKPDDDVLKNLKKSNLINISDKEILEISFARMIDENIPAEKQIKGLVTSVIRQISFSILEKNKEKLIVAYTDPENVLSEGVLKNSGFVIKGKVFYDKKSKEEDNFWVLDKDELEKILKKKRAKYANKTA